MDSQDGLQSAASIETASPSQRKGDEILAAATQIFSEKGFADTDVQLIADRAGVGKGTVYRHFLTKENLFHATLAKGWQQLRAEVDREVTKDKPALEKLRAGCLAFLNFYDRHPEYVPLVVQERANFPDRQPTFFGCPEDQAAQEWQQLLHELIAGRVLRDLPVEQIMDIVGKFLYGTVFVNYFRQRDDRPDLPNEVIVDVIFQGILRSPTSGNEPSVSR